MAEETEGTGHGAEYAADRATISGGISYIVPGDQLVNSSVGQANFNNNEVIAAGLRVTEHSVIERQPDLEAQAE